MGQGIEVMCRWAKHEGFSRTPSPSSCPYSPECLESVFS